MIKRRDHVTPATGRDVINLTVLMAFSGILIWIVCDLCYQQWVPKEVAGMFGTIAGYLFLRRFRY